MDRRFVLPLAAMCALAGAGAMWTMSPDTGPPIGVGIAKEQPTRASSKPAERKRPRRQVVHQAPPPAPVPVDEPLQPLPPTPAFAANDAAGRYVVQEPDLKGLANAAAARRSDVIACWTEWTGRYGTPPGRLTLAVTVADDGSGPVVSARLPTPQPRDEELHECLDGAFADARFATGAGDMQTMYWPVPLPTRY